MTKKKRITCFSSFNICLQIEDWMVPMQNTSSCDALEVLLLPSNTFKQQKTESKRSSILSCSSEYVQATFLTCASSARKTTCHQFFIDTHGTVDVY